LTAARGISQRLLGACGILAPAAFAAADIFGSVLTPGYSAWSDAISELVEKGAARKSLVDPLLVLYHALVIPFSVGIHRAVYGSRTIAAGPVLLGLAGGIGIVLTLFFPCDPGCEPFVTRTGTMHILLAIPMGISIVVAIWLVGRRMRRTVAWQNFATYSLGTAALGLSLALVTVALAESGHVGVLERILTYAYLQWYVVLGVAIAAGRGEDRGIHR
jgi:hypothetical membrane protein